MKILIGIAFLFLLLSCGNKHTNHMGMRAMPGNDTLGCKEGYIWKQVGDDDWVAIGPKTDSCNCNGPKDTTFHPLAHIPILPQYKFFESALNPDSGWVQLGRKIDSLEKIDGGVAFLPSKPLYVFVKKEHWKSWDTLRAIVFIIGFKKDTTIEYSTSGHLFDARSYAAASVRGDSVCVYEQIMEGAQSAVRYAKCCYPICGQFESGLIKVKKKHKISQNPHYNATWSSGDIIENSKGLEIDTAHPTKPWWLDLIPVDSVVRGKFIAFDSVGNVLFIDSVGRIIKDTSKPKYINVGYANDLDMGVGQELFAAPKKKNKSHSYIVVDGVPDMALEDNAIFEKNSHTTLAIGSQTAIIHYFHVNGIWVEASQQAYYSYLISGKRWRLKEKIGKDVIETLAVDIQTGRKFTIKFHQTIKP